MEPFTISNYIKPNYKDEKILSWDFFANISSINFWDTALYKECSFDLSGLSFITPSGFLWIEFLLLNRYLDRLTNEIVMPRNRDQNSFIKYIGFEELIKKIPVRIINLESFYKAPEKYGTLDRYKSKLKNHLLVTFRKYREDYGCIEETLNDYLKILLNLFREERFRKTESNAFYIEPLDESKVLINGFCQIIYELMENIAEHGGYSDNRGAGIISLTPPKNESYKYSLCFSDCGRGLVKCFIDELEKNKNRQEVQEILENLNKENKQSNSFFKKLVGYVLIYRFLNPKSNGYIGFYKILPFFSLYKAKVKIRTDTFLCNVDFSGEGFYEFYEKYKAPDIDWISSFINKTTRRCFIPGFHLNIDLQIPNNSQISNEAIWKSLIRF